MKTSKAVKLAIEGAFNEGYCLGYKEGGEWIIKELLKRKIIKIKKGKVKKHG
jgi:hypothetical protein